MKFALAMIVVVHVAVPLCSFSHLLSIRATYIPTYLHTAPTDYALPTYGSHRLAKSLMRVKNDYLKLEQILYYYYYYYYYYY